MFKENHTSINFNFVIYFLILLFFLIYLFFPSQNSGIDAYNYAANVKWNHEIFFPHHLLYNLLPYCIIKFLQIFNYQIDHLALMKMINAVFAAFGLLVFYKILINQNDEKKNHIALILIAGSCFGYMRYATENETYIMPIFWSLLATNYFLKYLKSGSKKAVLWTGLFATIACLFHQIHILWYAGLLIGIVFYRKDIKNALIMAVPAVLLPIVYFFAFKQVHYEFVKAQNLWEFVFYDYYFGIARVRFGMDNFILGFIGLIRSFIQVHGLMLFQVKKNYLYVLAIVPLLFSIYQLAKHLLKTKINKTKSSVFPKILMIVFSLHFGFAIFSEGNAEFMVMIPMMLLLIINGLVLVKPVIYFNLGMAILIWNLAFGIVPNHYYNFQKQEKAIQMIDNKKNAIFILSEDVLVQNMLYYKKGVGWNYRVYKSPANLKQQNKSVEKLRIKIDSCLNNKVEIITDCIDEPKVMNRKQYLGTSENDFFFKDYKILKTDSVNSFSGTRYFSKIESRMNIYKIVE